MIAEMQTASVQGPVVRAQGLRKAYGKTVALGGADFEIQPGRIVGLIGPNGAGKTTALKAMLGLVPFEGELSVLGRDPRHHPGQAGGDDRARHHRRYLREHRVCALQSPARGRRRSP